MKKLLLLMLTLLPFCMKAQYNHLPITKGPGDFEMKSQLNCFNKIIKKYQFYITKLIITVVINRVRGPISKNPFQHSQIRGFYVKK